MNQRPLPCLRLSAVLLLVASGPGCTSVLTSASLRDLVWESDEHAAESAATAEDGGLAETDAGDAAEQSTWDATTEVDDQRRKAAVEEAVARLEKLGSLGEAARATLTETLDRTEPEDWPVVIDAFAESLADAGLRGDAPEPAADEADAHVVAKADLDAATDEPPPATEDPPAAQPPEPEPAADPDDAAPLVAVGPVATSAATAGPPDPATVEASAVPADPVTNPRLVVQNACFASRVQAWGLFDRFPEDRFRPGQEVIVYFELDGLSAGESPAGHTTCIDATLRLVADDDRQLHAWTFEPIAETCRSRRHDYFARYVVRIPETAAAGPCGLQLRVTDTLSGQLATASLPLEILPAAGP